MGHSLLCMMGFFLLSAVIYGNAKVPIKPTVILQPSWTQIYRGETVTIRCEIQGGGETQWKYEWRPAKLNTPPTSSEYRIIKATESDSGGYRCRGKGGKSLTEWSEIITLTVSYQLACGACVRGGKTAERFKNWHQNPIGGKAAWEETLRQTHDTLEKLHLSPGLEMLWCLPGRAG
ncbi:high affinity immunoglobulin gamma Fc receptor IB-like [Archocentrus centrarchus]|uniref:high affinity immunoglobulin gamma Fc receptor IB-like n=1 Tax=Archocentrus centrarchus TaxID=63155 RepID=UPI0011E9DAAC|nr:high affinity immunoglobulin gamma Fc receptor IB-like [Archocentrus centrarchus]